MSGLELPSPGEPPRRANRGLVFGVAVAALLAGAALGWLGHGWLRPEVAAVPAEPEPEPEPAAPAPPPRLDLEPASFVDLPGWREDGAAAAFAAFRQSCPAFARLPADRLVAPQGERSVVPAVPAATWQGICRRAARVGQGDAAARAFFEAELVPWSAHDGESREAFFTGYYEASLRGSRRRGGAYQTPLLTRPGDIIEVDLGAFREEWKGQRIGGRLVGSRLEPYPDRAAIEAGALAGKKLEMLWVDDPVDAFFLHIQGSGRVTLPNGTVERIGYGGQNGRPYVAIGKELIERGELTREEVSMQSIRRWLEIHPDQATELLNKNPSYVFFRRLNGPGPLGSQGVPLSPGRSLAVDRRFLPLGTPVYLDATAPGPREGDPDRPLQRLAIAQDTGGAIVGPLRGDLFWGAGDEPAAVAGRMKHRGRMWLLLPRS